MARAPARASRRPRRRGVRVMQSNGGLVGGGDGGRRAGAHGALGPGGRRRRRAPIARGAPGFARIITLDMGGTSTDVSLVDGAPAYRSETTIGGLPVRVPAIDIHTVGAGGGSLARVDAGGALRVGPESAGADPGPACYGRGTLPTVTDANLVLGRLVETEFLGGDDAARRRRARARRWRRSRAGSAARSRRRRPASSRSRPRPWSARCASSPSSAGTIRATSRWSPSAARAGCTPPSSRARSACGACTCRAIPGCCRPGACSPAEPIRDYARTLRRGRAAARARSRAAFAALARRRAARHARARASARPRLEPRARRALRGPVVRADACRYAPRLAARRSIARHRRALRPRATASGRSRW